MKMKHILMACCMPLIVYSKSQFCKSTFGRNKPASDYCTKFGVGEDQTMTVEVQAQFVMTGRHSERNRDPDARITVQAAIYEDQNWDDLMAGGNDCAHKRSLAKQIIDMKLSLNGSWSHDIGDKPFEFKPIISHDRPHIYFFKILDCNKEVSEKFGDQNPPRIRSKWVIKSKDSWDYETDNSSHFTYEDSSQYSLYFWLWISTAIINLVIMKMYYEQYQTSERLFTPHILIIVALIFQCGSLWFETFHLYLYQSDGTGVMAFDIFGKIFGTISEVIMSLLFVLMASGWTITYQEIDFDDSLDIYLPLGAIVVVVHIMIAALDFVDIDDAHKYHDFAGLQGYFLIGAKVILLAYFLYSIRHTKLNEKLNRRATEYLMLVFNIGSLYLSAIPVAIFTCYCCSPYNRQFVFVFIKEAIMKVTIVTMFYQLWGKKTKYHKGNLDSQGVLPGSESLD